MTEKRDLNSLDYVSRRVRLPLEQHEPIGLTQVVGTHGTQVDSIHRLARDGKFSGGAAEVLSGKFYITPNVRCRDWQATDFAYEINNSPGVDPIEAAKIYADAGSLARFMRDQENEQESFEPPRGVVITFGRRVLQLVDRVDVNGLNEPEAELSEAPPLESIRSIYPVDEMAAAALHQVLNSLR